MSESVQFRASAAGNCVRHLAASVLRPELVEPSEEKRPFLNMGHRFEDEVVEDFLPSQGFEIAGRQAEGIIKRNGYQVVGHVEGIILGGKGPGQTKAPRLFEVKAVTRAWWEKVADGDWRDIYPGYQAQVQVYMRSPDLIPATFPEVFRDAVGDPAVVPGTCPFIFVNRDNSYMLGGLKIDHPAYTYRADMVERRSGKTADLFARYDAAYAAVQEGQIPDVCDKVGWCYFCQAYGRGEREGPQEGLTVYFGRGEKGSEDIRVAASDLLGLKEEKAACDVHIKKVRKCLLDMWSELSPLPQAIEIATDDGAIRLSRAEVRTLRADSDVVKEMVAVGRIPRVEGESVRLGVERVEG